LPYVWICKGDSIYSRHVREVWGIGGHIFSDLNGKYVSTSRVKKYDERGKSEGGIGQMS